ncbi:hypothetical protein [Gordonia soli]|nr:hypothetical protein [Gordonia soli]
MRARVTVDDLPAGIDQHDVENEIIIALGLHFSDHQITVEFEAAA